MPSNNLTFDLPPGVDKACNIGRYIQHLLRKVFDSDYSIPPSDIDLRTKAECQHVARVVAEARQHIHRLPWTIDSYAKTVKAAGYQPFHNKDDEEKRSEDFPPIAPVEGAECYCFRVPTIFLDKNGVIVFWYLPGIVGNYRQDLIDQFVKQLGRAEATPLATNIGGGWKDHPALFQPSRHNRLKPGYTSFSPATYGSPWHWDRRPSGESVPLPSPPSLGNPASGGLSFFQSMSDTFAILGGALAVTHPRLFDSGLQTMESISQGRFPIELSTSCKEALQHWSSPFSCIDVSVNRETLLHRDVGHMATGYTSIVYTGRYDLAVMECPGMGVRFSFMPGTMVIGMLGLLEYGLSMVDGDSIMLTSHFDGALLSRFSDLTPGWPPKLMGWDLNFLKPNAGIDQRGYTYKSHS